MTHSVDIDLGSRVITLETGKLAKQAHGAVVVRSSDTVVLCTACSNDEPKPGAAFFPLTVDYREYTYAAGRIPGGYLKREGRPSDREILTSRLIDRPIRPLFPEGYMCETQVIGMVLSAAPDTDPSTMGIIGACAALAITDIPFEHVLAGVRIAKHRRRTDGRSQLRTAEDRQAQHRRRRHRNRHRHGRSRRSARRPKRNSSMPSSSATTAARN